MRVGLLGAGQLARMMVLAGAPLGLRFELFDPSAQACAGDLAPLTVADWSDRAALEALAERVEVASFDFENVPLDAALALAERVAVRPSPRALGLAQDRLDEKRLFASLDIPVPTHAAVDDEAGLAEAVARIGLPAVLKTRRLGYDGKGQFWLREAVDLEAAWQTLGGVPLILEAAVPFRAEYSVLAVRGVDGELRCYPPVQNVHRGGILSASRVPSGLSVEREAQAMAYAMRLAETLDYVGCLALELFDTEAGLLANEMAPRVHNSGHWTIEGAHCSQFENHLRAICALPLGSTAPRGSALMLNLVGSLPPAKAVLALEGWHWHDYGKTPRPGRKLGHLSTVADDESGLRERFAALCAAVPDWRQRWVDPWAGPGRA